MQGAQVQSLVRELRFHMPHRVAKKKKSKYPSMLFGESYVLKHMCCNIQEDSRTTWKLENRLQLNPGLCPITASGKCGVVHPEE